MKTKTQNLAPAAVLLVAIVSASGCSGLVMTQKAQRVLVTDSISLVEPCKPRGVVFALAPFSSPDQPVAQLKIRASQIGADTVVIKETSAPTGDWSGKAYRCGNTLRAAELPAGELEAERQPER